MSWVMGIAFNVLLIGWITGWFPPNWMPSRIIDPSKAEWHFRRIQRPIGFTVLAIEVIVAVMVLVSFLKR